MKMDNEKEIRMLKDIIYKHSKRIHNLEESLRQLVKEVVGSL